MNALFRRLFLRLRRDRRGAAAIEFAMAAPIYLAVLMATIETGVIIGLERFFESGVATASREIRTGAAQTEGLDLETLRARVCDSLVGVFTCSRLRLDLQTFATFETLSLPPTIDDEGRPIEDETFVNPGPSELVALRVRYVWPVFTDVFGIGVGNTASGDRQFTATFVFKTEPFAG